MEIGLGAFIRFANATPKARPRIARQIADQVTSEYAPATDFWRPVRQAIVRDRKTTRDGSALHQVVQVAPTVRRPSFEAIRDRWSDVAPRWNGASHIPSGSKRIDLGDVLIRTHPLVAEQWGDGHREAAYFWFNKEELGDDTMRLVQHLIAREAEGSVAPVFVDMRRGIVAPAELDAPDLDTRLEELGHEYRRLTD